MIRALAGLVLLAGCASAGKPAANPLMGLNTFTQADLKNAIEIATKAGPAGAEIVSCFTFLKTALSALDAQTVPLPSGGGAATAFTVADLALNSLSDATGGGGKMPFEIACGSLIVHVEQQALSLVQQINHLAALVALVPK